MPPRCLQMLAKCSRNAFRKMPFQVPAPLQRACPTPVKCLRSALNRTKCLQECFAKYFGSAFNKCLSNSLHLFSEPSPHLRSACKVLGNGSSVPAGVLPKCLPGPCGCLRNAPGGRSKNAFQCLCIDVSFSYSSSEVL